MRIAPLALAALPCVFDWPAAYGLGRGGRGSESARVADDARIERILIEVVAPTV